MELDILNEVLSREAQTTLYHYANQAGLLGIIGNREIWATHTQYLNGSKEYRHAVDVVTDLITKRLTDAVGDSRRILEDIWNGYATGKHFSARIERNGLQPESFSCLGAEVFRRICIVLPRF